MPKTPKSTETLESTIALATGIDTAGAALQKKWQPTDNLNPKRDWDVEKALNMRRKGKSYAEIAERVDAPPTTIRSRLRKFLDQIPFLREVEEFKKREGELIDGTRALALVQLRDVLADPERAAKIHPQTLTWIFGVLYDKQRLERGESTANIGVLSAVVEAIHAKKVNEPDKDNKDAVEVAFGPGGKKR